MFTYKMVYRQLKITYIVSTYLYSELKQYIYRHTNIGQCLQNLLLITCNISEVKSAVTTSLQCVYKRLLNNQVFLHFYNHLSTQFFKLISIARYQSLLTRGSQITGSMISCKGVFTQWLVWKPPTALPYQFVLAFLSVQWLLHRIPHTCSLQEGLGGVLGRDTSASLQTADMTPLQEAGRAGRALGLSSHQQW